MAFQYAVVLTGSIGTGKSSTAGILEKLGLQIIDADSIAHKILNEEHQAIGKLFGSHLIHDEIVDRKALGEIVFEDTKKRKRLEELLHPLIYIKIEYLAAKLDKNKIPYLVDIPLFFEGNRYPITKSLVVYTPIGLQLQRLMRRDNSNTIDAQKRIDTQISIEEKRAKADYVIDNSGTLAQLEHECRRVYDEILKDFT